MKPFLIELFGTILYISIRLYTHNPWIVGLSLAILLFIIQLHHAGSFNPALDFASIFSGNVNKWRIIRHISAQFGGALIAGVLFYWIFEK